MTQEVQQARHDRPSLPKLLWRYEEADYVTAYKARFIFYFSFACIAVVLVAMAYTLAIQLNNPDDPSPNLPMLLSEAAAAALIAGIIGLLVRGRFALAAHGLILAALASIWTVIFLDRGHPITKLDSVAFVFAVLAMAPLLVRQRASVLVWLSLGNIAVLMAFLFFQRERLDLPAVAFYDYLADTTLALLFVCVAIYNTFSINRHALERLEQDIQRRIEVEAALRRSQEEARSLLQFKNEMLETAALWIHSLDTQGKVLTWNKAAERISGYSKEEVLGHDRVWTWLYPDPEYRQEALATVAAILSSDLRVENLETRILCKDGQTRFLSWNSNSLRGGSGAVVGTIALGADVTERRREQENRERLEAQVLQMQKMDSIGRLAGGVAHDFNNMLTAILGSAELALARLTPEDPNHARLMTIKHASESAAHLTRQLLAFSRKQVIAPKLLDLNEAIQRTSPLLQRMIGEQVRLQTDLGKDLPSVKLDPGQVEQIILNLAVNARDAMPEGGRLSLETSEAVLDETNVQNHSQTPPGRYVMLSVSDSGCGMSPEVLEHLFEPFFTTKGPGKGTGLGLATVYGAVKQNGGSIECHSEVGCGTTFRILFPVAHGAGESPSLPPSASTWPEGSETVLVVEDNPHVLAFAEAVLARQGYRTLLASSGEQALRISEAYEDPIHLVVTDVILPDINGRIVSERLKVQRPNIRVLFASGYSGDILSKSGVLEESIDLISKPFSALFLAQRVRDTLDRPL